MSIVRVLDKYVIQHGLQHMLFAVKFKEEK